MTLELDMTDLFQCVLRTIWISTDSHEGSRECVITSTQCQISIILLILGIWVRRDTYRLNWRFTTDARSFGATLPGN